MNKNNKAVTSTVTNKDLAELIKAQNELIKDQEAKLYALNNNSIEIIHALQDLKFSIKNESGKTRDMLISQAELHDRLSFINTAHLERAADRIEDKLSASEIGSKIVSKAMSQLMAFQIDQMSKIGRLSERQISEQSDAFVKDLIAKITANA